MTHLRKVMVLLAVLLVPLAASAQRTAKGQSLISADILYTASKGLPLGCSLEYGQYLLSSYWDAGVCMANRATSISTGGLVDYTHFYAYGDFMYRLCGTHNRSVSLYAGGGVYLGYEAFDCYNKLPSNIEVKDGSGKFLYGVRPQVLGEFFLTDSFALTVRVRVPFNWCSPTGWVKCEAGVGARFNFK